MAKKIKEAEKTTDTIQEPVSVEEKLRLLYELQVIDRKIDNIYLIRGELPLEVQDLEDEVAGLETRIAKLTKELADLEAKIAQRKNAIKDSQALILKYENQQMNVRNNREFDSLSKEIEYQTLEIQLNEKRIKEHKFSIAQKEQLIEDTKQKLADRKIDLEAKKKELESIVSETKGQEEELLAKSKLCESKIEERLLTAYKKLRKNARNGLAIVPIERDACGGCFSKIPLQRQAEIKTRKKILVCEHCGRIIVDAELAMNVEGKLAETQNA